MSIMGIMSNSRIVSIVNIMRFTPPGLLRPDLPPLIDLTQGLIKLVHGGMSSTVTYRSNIFLRLRHFFLLLGPPEVRRNTSVLRES